MKKTVWLLVDNRQGSAGQIRGIAQQLSPQHYTIIEHQLAYNALSALPNWIRGSSLLGVSAPSLLEHQGDYPDIILSGSRRSAPVARWIKKHSHGRSKIVQLLYPGMFGRKDFDLIVIPEHDRGKISGDNVRFVTGSPHRITPASLSAARSQWQDSFASLPRPLTAVIIGGRIKGKGFSAADALAFGQAIKHFHQARGGSLLITDSRRTGTEGEQIILQQLSSIPSYTYLIGDNKPNPYMGYLACADYILVSGDSVSMCCEACGTGKPVYIFSGRDWLTPKHHRFVDSLLKGGYAASLEAMPLDFQPRSTLNPAAEIASAISKL